MDKFSDLLKIPVSDLKNKIKSEISKNIYFIEINPKIPKFIKISMKNKSEEINDIIHL